jgi:hypothetical protein
MRRFFLEGLVIVFSILLAFGVDAWWDGVLESRRRDALVSGLIADFTATRRDVVAATAEGEALVQRISDFLALRRRSSLPSLDTVQFLALGIGLPPPAFAPTTANYEAALQSGDMGLLDGVEFYAALAEFHRAEEWVTRHWELSFFNFLPVMIPSGPDCVAGLFHPAQGPIYCPYPEDWALSAEEIVSLLNDRELYSGFETVGNVYVNYLIGFRMLDAAVERVLAALSEMQ